MAALLAGIAWELGSSWVVATLFGTEGGVALQSGRHLVYLSGACAVLFITLRKLLPRALQADRLSALTELLGQSTASAVIVLDTRSRVVEALNFGLSATIQDLDVSTLRPGVPLWGAQHGLDGLVGDLPGQIQNAWNGGPRSFAWSGVFQGERRFLRTELLLIRDGTKPTGTAIVVTDETLRRYQTIANSMLLDATRALTRGSSAREIADLLADELQRQMGWALVWFGERRADGSVGVIASRGKHAEYPSSVSIRWDRGPLSEGPTGRCIRSGQAQTMDHSDPNYEPWRVQTAALALGASASFPTRDASGNVNGAMSVYLDRTVPFDQETIDRLETWVEIASSMIATATERDRSRMIAGAVGATSEAVLITNREGQIEWVNPAFTLLTGYALADVIGQTPRILKSGIHDSEYYQRLWTTILSGKPFRSRLTNRTRRGLLYTVDEIITPIRDRDGQVERFVAIQLAPSSESLPADDAPPHAPLLQSRPRRRA